MRAPSSLFSQPSFFPSKLGFPKTLSAMCSASSPSFSSSSAVRLPAVQPVPGLTADEISAAASEIFARHCFAGAKRPGDGVAIVWFRNDLRVLDNDALLQGWAASNALLPVYCVDPRHFGSTHLFGFPKTGALRAKFLLEAATKRVNRPYRF
ncbi:cryptochrome DASH, chloroplastic/mitochondrial-like [Phalaenopsis equestris]|uniref:cryptochrome DASH, chloroplastic/mitochondrial-like n=1 Tax=Phalaenopsis equestris TaxID=78828 RepID=UPI0009E4F173|nr:cryptochrome DASH, chloroplastic/mitochondrial-like [Phalaenopsis equestris]